VLSIARRKSASDVVALRLLGATAHPRLEGLGRLAGTANYLVGADRARWRAGIPSFSRVRYAQVWPGVNVDFHGNRSRLEYDLNLAPGADPARVGFAFAGARSLRLTGSGDLLVGLAHGSLRQPRPLAYQWLGSHRQPVPVGYALGARGHVALHLGLYDHRRALIVDPGLVYSTYLGGSGADKGFSIAIDSSGDAFVTGQTNSPNFPTTASAFQTSLGGTSSTAFVTKLNATGSALLYSTYLGGSGQDGGQGIAIDSSGDAFVTGRTSSSNFPAIAGAFQTSLGGEHDASVTKLNATGSALLYSTYLGGSGFDDGVGIAIDSSGDAFVTGVTKSENFPVTPFSFQRTCQLGPHGEKICSEAFVTKLNPTGSALSYSTYLGGNGANGNGIAVDSSGDAYVAGTGSKLNAEGRLLYSMASGNGIAVDSSGDAFVTGGAGALLTVTPGAFQTTFGGVEDAYVAKIATPAELGPPHWYRNASKVALGEKVGAIGWGTLTLESSAGNVTCHSAQAANLENTAGAARQETVLLATWECKAVGGKCAGSEARLRANSLPSTATGREEGEEGSGLYRQQAAGIELASECYVGGKLTESLTFKTGPVLAETGTSTPAWLNGTTATKPSETFFDPSSGHLYAESEGKAISGTPKGKLKFVGYQDNAAVPLITLEKP
jgi:hypothetical protein